MMEISATTTILDLNDECLLGILKYLDSDTSMLNWPEVCVRFRYILNLYESHKSMRNLHERNCLDDNIVKRFVHLIGTPQFPMKTIRKIHLSKCDRSFLRILREKHPEIEEAELWGFTDECLEALLPLPRLKFLACSNSYQITGKYIDELNSLEILYFESGDSVQSEYLLGITRYNKLRGLKIRNCPGALSERFTQQIVDNLMHLEVLVLMVEWDTDTTWQLLGTLPQLRSLDISGFITRQCDACKNIINGRYYIEHTADTSGWAVCKCGSYQARLLFAELRRRQQLVQLFVRRSWLTERDLKHISQLTSLRCLHLSSVVYFRKTVCLATFGNLVNLEDFYIGSEVCVKEALTFVEKCQRLKIVHFYYVKGFEKDFITRAIEIIRQRPMRPIEPVEFFLTGVSRDYRVVEDERVKAAKRLVKITFNDV